MAKAARPGQFVILRLDEEGERVPFTICDSDKKNETITLLVQDVGYTTHKMSTLNEGDYILDLAGPLGNPTDITGYKNILLIGGGIGNAVTYPQAKYLASEKRNFNVIVGARNKELIMYESEFKAQTENVHIVTDDGSYGDKGNVVSKLSELLEGGLKPDCVIAVGPLGMMQAVCEFTRPLEIKTIVSMNSLMLDGTGMCGCCRVSYDGKVKYACVDGPEFDGHKIDFDEARSRLVIYREHEEACRIRGRENG